MAGDTWQHLQKPGLYQLAPYYIYFGRVTSLYRQELYLGTNLVRGAELNREAHD